MPTYRVNTTVPYGGRGPDERICHMQHTIRAKTQGEARSTAQSLAVGHAERQHGAEVHPMKVAVTDLALLPEDDA